MLAADTPHKAGKDAGYQNITSHKLQLSPVTHLSNCPRMDVILMYRYKFFFIGKRSQNKLYIKTCKQ